MGGWVMSGRSYERPADEPLTDLSVSRISTVSKCALAFKYTYVDKLPAATESAGMLFGNVVHDGVEEWYGEPGSGNHERTFLASYFHTLWERYLPAGIWAATDECLKADNDLAALSEAICISRPTLKAPRQTKDFLNSPEFAKFEDLRESLLAKCDKIAEMRWPQNENPMQAYRKSMDIARSLQERWRNQPRPMAVEHPFLLKFEGYVIKGRIDQIRQDTDENGELKPVELLDIKTGKQKLTQMEAFVQAFLYDEACEQLEGLPQPDHVTFWMARHGVGQTGRINRDRHRVLARKILNSVARTIITGDWQPSYGMWCKSCDFAPLCEKEVGLWPVGEDSLELSVDVEPVLHDQPGVPNESDRVCSNA